MSHYVYILFRETGVPFYVGMGKGDRWLKHERLAAGSNDYSHRSNVIRKVISAINDLPKIKVQDNLTREEAIEIEIALIAAIGREPNGPLINQTKGGDGVLDKSPEAIARIIASNLRRKGEKRDPDVGRRISASKKGKTFISDEQRQAISRALTGRKASEETKAKLRGRVWTDEQRAKLIGRKISPETRKKLSEAHKGYVFTTDSKKKISIALTGIRRSEETKRKVSINNQTKNLIWITDGISNSRIFRSTEVPVGWRLGRTCSPALRAAVIRAANIRWGKE